MRDGDEWPILMGRNNRAARRDAGLPPTDQDLPPMRVSAGAALVWATAAEVAVNDCQQAV